MSNMLDEANATSKGEFVRQAIRFYISYLHQKKSIDFISPLLANTIKSEIESVENNISEMLFKVAVELAILNNLNAVDCNCNMETLSELRNSCANVVVQNNGIINFEKAYEWQKTGIEDSPLSGCVPCMRADSLPILRHVMHCIKRPL